VGVVGRAVQWLPRGNTLPRGVLVARHRGILVLLWAHVPALVGFSLSYGQGNVQELALVLSVVALAALASRRPFHRTSRRVWATLGLLSCSAASVEISGGLTEAHFHFFVVVAVIALYQDWVVFLLAIGFVAVHHATLSILLPHSVFDHAMAQAQPARWALIHATFVLAAAAAHLVAWRSSEQATYDSLTGLASAGLLVHQLERALERGPTAVIFADLDGFKHVNDRLGHLAGDQLLVGVARRMERVLRDGDSLGRQGGDEFVVVLPGADGQQAAAIAARLVHEMAEPFLLPGGIGRVGISAGVVAASKGSSAERLLAAADAAMYQAKQSGKGRIALADAVPSMSLDGMEVGPAVWAGTSLASCRGLPAGANLGR